MEDCIFFLLMCSIIAMSKNILSFLQSLIMLGGNNQWCAKGRGKGDRGEAKVTLCAK